VPGRTGKGGSSCRKLAPGEPESTAWRSRNAGQSGSFAAGAR